MNKSVMVIGGMGGLGCVALFLMMQHTLKIKADQISPVAKELHGFYADQLAAPVSVESLVMEGRETMLVKLWVVPRIDCEQFGRTTSKLIWTLGENVLKKEPQQLQVVVFNREQGPKGKFLPGKPSEAGAHVIVTTHPPSSWKRDSVRRVAAQAAPVAPKAPVAAPQQPPAAPQSGTGR